jgi:hypothetical protein
VHRQPVEAADGIGVSAPEPLPLVRRAYLYLDWLDAQAGGAPSGGLAGTLAAQPGMRRRRAPGNTCLSALRAGGHGEVGRPINGSKGCGAAMHPRAGTAAMLDTTRTVSAGGRPRPGPWGGLQASIAVR